MEELENLKKPVITLNDIVKARDITRESARVEVNRWAKKGLITNVERGKYAITKDVFAIATGLIQPSYISFGAALYLRGFLEQTISRVDVVSPRYRKGVKFGNVDIRFAKFRSDRIFGYEKMERGKFYAFVAETDKAVADCLCFPRYFELSYLDAAFKGIDAKKLEAYVARMGSAAAIKRAGYLLERAGYETTLGGKLSGVHQFIPGKRGRWNNRWRLYV
jgi:predicted transcriptional regulator of viral defense system